LGLPCSVEAARTGSWGDSGSSNPWIHKLGRLMAWSMIGYYPLEHIAYLRWTSPQLLPGRNAEKMSAYSCRFWLAYIVADMTKSILKCKELLRRRSELVTDDDHEKEVSIFVFLKFLQKCESRQCACFLPLLYSFVTQALVSLNHSIHNEQLQIVRSLLFTLPAIHWSLPRWDTHPWLKESVVNGLMWTEAVVSFYQSLYSFQG
jgi:hypothetical protein